jgi:hypothetical protein
LEFEHESNWLHKEVKEKEWKNVRKARKDSFQEYLELSLTSFLEKKEVFGRSETLERSNSGGVALSKKRERDPINGLAGKINVKAFKFFQKYSKYEEIFSSEGRSRPSDQFPNNEDQVQRRKDLNHLILAQEKRSHPSDLSTWINSH